MGKEKKEKRKSEGGEEVEEKDGKEAWAEKTKYLSPISKPLASRKLTKRLYKVIKKGACMWNVHVHKYFFKLSKIFRDLSRWDHIYFRLTSFTSHNMRCSVFMEMETIAIWLVMITVYLRISHHRGLCSEKKHLEKKWIPGTKNIKGGPHFGYRLAISAYYSAVKLDIDLYMRWFKFPD